MAYTAIGRYGKLWGRGHETFNSSMRRILSVKGIGATEFLQGLVTSDLLQSIPPKPREAPKDENNNAEEEEQEEVLFSPNVRSTCFLDHRGRIVTDAFLWKRTNSTSSSGGTNSDEENMNETEYLVDVPGDAADDLLLHMNQYKLRRTKVSITDKSEDMSVHCIYGTLNAEGSPPGYIAAVDPRHPSLGMRVISVGKHTTTDDDDTNETTTTTTTTTEEERRIEFGRLMSKQFPPSNGTYNVIRNLAGVAEGREIQGKTALECNQDFLSSISFSKGCYLGQELTARTQYTGFIRKRILPLILVDTKTQIPRPWMLAAQLQRRKAQTTQDHDDDDDDNNNNAEDHKKNKNKEKMIHPLTGEAFYPSLLPKISAPAAGGVVSILMGTSLSVPTTPTTPTTTTTTKQEDEEEEEKKEDDDDEDDNEMILEHKKQMETYRINAIKVSEHISKVISRGAKIIDTKNGKMIGQVLSSVPANGTNVILAQMRLDQVGLTDREDDIWTVTNKIRIVGNNSDDDDDDDNSGDDNSGDDSDEYDLRYLPYEPLWWPILDLSNGKEKNLDENE